MLLPSDGWRTVVPYEAKRWPGGVVPYEIHGFDSAYTAKIRAAMDRIEGYTKYSGGNCVTFKPKSNEWMYLKIQAGDACASVVGMGGSGEQITTLHVKCVEKEGIVIHELLHVLGMYHEQSRYDRDDYVDVIWDNIDIRGMKNFRIIPKGDAELYGLPYDYDSIMHYGAKYFSANKQDTIIPKKYGVTIGQRDHMSHVDIKKVQNMYKCSSLYSWECNFEIGTCGINIVTYLIGLWERSKVKRSDNIAAYSGGPNGDHTSGSGYYMVARAKTAPNQFHNPTFDIVRLPSTVKVGVCVSFWYHLYGSAGEKQQSSITIRCDYTLTKAAEYTTSDGWKKYQAHFKCFGGSEISITAITYPDSVDAAIDDIKIYEAERC